MCKLQKYQDVEAEAVLSYEGWDVYTYESLGRINMWRLKEYYHVNSAVYSYVEDGGGVYTCER